MNTFETPSHGIAISSHANICQNNSVLLLDRYISFARLDLERHHLSIPIELNLQQEHLARTLY